MASYGNNFRLINELNVPHGSLQFHTDIYFPSRREGRCDHRLYLWSSRSRKSLLRGGPGCSGHPAFPIGVKVCRASIDIAVFVAARGDACRVPVCGDASRGWLAVG